VPVPGAAQTWVRPGRRTGRWPRAEPGAGLPPTPAPLPSRPCTCGPAGSRWL